MNPPAKWERNSCSPQQVMSLPNQDRGRERDDESCIWPNQKHAIQILLSPPPLALVILSSYHQPSLQQHPLPHLPLISSPQTNSHETPEAALKARLEESQSQGRYLLEPAFLPPRCEDPDSYLLRPGQEL